MATTSIGAPGVTFPDATVQATAGGVAPIVRIYTSPSPWTKSPALKAVKVTVVSGGGAGGGKIATPAIQTSSGGGGGGAVAFGFFQSPAIAGPLTITVAAGVTGGPGSGATGNPSSFGPLVSCTGGAGGGAASTPNVNGAGGAGGTMTPSPSVFGLNGGTGGAAQAAISIAGLRSASNPASGAPVGGSSAFGFGQGGANLQNVAGNPGAGFGGGGSGAISQATALVGGSGTGGIIIVEEFY